MSSDALFHLSPTLDPRLGERLMQAFGKHGATSCAAPEASAFCIASLADTHAFDGQVAVGLYEGRLGAGVVPALLREPPTLLWASPPEGSPTFEAEVAALCALTGSRPLVSSMGKMLGQARVTSFEGIQSAAKAAGELAADVGVPAPVVGAVSDCMYELVANAILDAPVGPDEAPRYAFRRQSQPEIAPEDACEIAVGITPDWMLVTAIDRFGRLTPEPFVRVIGQLASKARINESGGGAGLGLRRILDLSELVVVRVSPKRATQVLCAIPRVKQRRGGGMRQSFFFWTEPT